MNKSPLTPSTVIAPRTPQPFELGFVEQFVSALDPELIRTGLLPKSEMHTSLLSCVAFHRVCLPRESSRSG